MTARIPSPLLFPAVRDYIEGADLSALLNIQNLVQAKLASFHPQQVPSPDVLATRVKGLTEIVEVYEEGWGRRIDLYERLPPLSGEARDKFMEGLFTTAEVKKKRTYQKMLVDHLFQGMKSALTDQKKLNEYLDALENLKLDSRELPQGKSNLAYYLYERLYFLYKAAADQPGSGLRDPQDPFFRNDFGRLAFRGEAGRIDQVFLMQSLEEVHRELLHNVWQQLVSLF